MAARTVPAPKRSATAPDTTTERTATANGNVTSQDATVLIDTSGGITVTQTLPLVAEQPQGRRMTFVWIDGASDAILAPQAADNVGPAGAGVAYSLASNAIRAVTLEADGVTTWEVVSAEGDIRFPVALLRALPLSALTVEAANVRSTQMTVQNGQGTTQNEDLAVRVQVWDDAVLATPSISGTVAPGVNGTAISGSGSANMVATANAVNGLLDLDITEPGAKSLWISIVPFPHLNNRGLILPQINVVTGAWA